MTCFAKHTEYQPNATDWHCPKCGATAEDQDGFIIADPAVDAADGCELLQDQDYVECGMCNWYGSGKKLAKILMTEAGRVICPTCKGKGTVNGKA
jgi:Zn finger protein HypA/HybF involved in hydrogenase expression